MKYKIFFFLFFLFLLFYLYLSNLNQEMVKLYVGYGRYYETSVADYVVVSFVLGVIITIIISFFYDIKKAVSGWREERREKNKEEFRDFLEKAKSYDLRGDREKAIEQLNKLVRKAPEMEEAYTFLSDMYTSMKEFDKATEVLELAEASLGKRESILLKKVKVYLATKSMEKIEYELKEVLRMNESNLEALALLRDFYIWKKDWNEAYELEKKTKKFIKTEDENRRFVGIRFEKVRELYNKKFEANSETIMKDLKEMLGEDKRFIPAYVLLAEVYKRMGKLNEAGRVYGRGYSKTGHIIFLLKMEDLYIDRGDPGVILKIYRKILDISPKNHLISFLYARLCLRLEMIDESIDTLNRLLAEGEEFKGLHRAMAEAYIHRGEIEKAVEEFRSAFPMKHVYIPFSCKNCQAVKEEWADFCDSCYSWSTINVKKEEFLPVESTELKTLYEGEDWDRGE
ncbi:MAG: tetratricopeptide repeat protein [Proteobacteria bacterium]|nr:tetratricopeptide repeat protein [Pseudomonadota bacterium]